ncbi:MAG: carbohydrate ABC transporter permease, partial [Anaerolineae bacterium]|nr:carbohydrate ABC transporter permease [Anaerolineae bacterium]
LGVLAVTWLIPFLWMVSSSLKVERQLFTWPPIWIPSPVDWRNYVEAVQAVPFFLYLRNTVVIALLSCVGNLISCPPTAYSFSRLQWPGRNLLFMVTLATMMIPYQVTMVPLFLIFNKLGWINTWLPLIAPEYFGAAFFIFLLRQFFLTIPNDLSDAARIDGAGEGTIFLRVILPLTKPALAVIVLFQTLWKWTDFIGPLIYLSQEELYTISLGLQQYVSRHATAWTSWLAASTLGTLPVIILFVFTQQFFIEGITFTGLKG